MERCFVLFFFFFSGSAGVWSLDFGIIGHFGHERPFYALDSSIIV